MNKRQDIGLVFPYLRVAAHLKPEAGPELIGKLAGVLAPRSYQAMLRNLTEKDVIAATKSKPADRRTFFTLCCALLRIILAGDGWTVTCIRKKDLEDGSFGINLSKLPGMKTNELLRPGVLAARKGKRKILFCFDDQGRTVLERAFRAIARKDKNAFNLICVLIARRHDDLMKLRSVREASKLSRAFFTSFEELRKAAEEADGVNCRRICASAEETEERAADGGRQESIASFRAVVERNFPVGGHDASHFKLSIVAPEMQGVQPGQFVMLNTAPRRRMAVGRPVSWHKLRSSFDLKPRSFLKRPFGIHRSFYPNLERDYLKNLCLPPSLAVCIHTVLPCRFDIFYKVPAHGVGTREMTKLRPGDKIHMIGPLGKPFNVRSLRADGIEEVHVIGGGVGMAPLIFFVQALMYCSFRVKAFIGISKLEALKYEASKELAATFGEEAGDAYIYIDDLLAAGLDPKDIYLSCDSEKPEKSHLSIPRENLYHGLVVDQYKQFIKCRPGSVASGKRGSAGAFACGPMPMMKAVRNIARGKGIRLWVLMEKRMACGIGVCLSCVCKTEGRNGKQQYTRVCTEGPVFDADRIVWDARD